MNRKVGQYWRNRDAPAARHHHGNTSSTLPGANARAAKRSQTPNMPRPAKRAEPLNAAYKASTVVV